MTEVGVITDAFADDLLQVVRRDLGNQEVTFAVEPTPMKGGFWARLASFRLAGAVEEEWSGPLVARVMPDPHTAARETVFQRAAAAQEYPTPRVLAAGGPDDGIGGEAYVVMEHAPGRPLLAGLDGVGAILRLPALAGRLPSMLADVLARLHGLDPAPVAEALTAAGVEEPLLPSTVRRLEAMAHAVGRPDIAAAAAWLRSHPPRDWDRVVVCHGDIHPFNVLVADDGTTTVLDWSTAVLAPAGYDVGYTSLLLAEPPLAVGPLLRPVVRRLGRILSSRFVRAYERRAGPLDREALGWYQAIVCVRALVEVAEWVAAGTVDEHSGHPWLVLGDVFAARLAGCTNIPVRAR